MAKITQELQNTVAANRHIEKVYFDKKDDFYFNAHEHKGKYYHRIRKQVVTDRAKPNARPETVIEAKPEHELVENLSRSEVLNSKPVNEAPLTAEGQARVDALQKQLKDITDAMAKMTAEKEEKEKAEADEKALAEAIAEEEKAKAQ